MLLEERLEIVNNADWLGTMRFQEILDMTSRVTVAQILERDDFSRRLAEQHPLSVMELLYPVLQGQDSVAMRSDVELGGTDQTFNMLVGRHLQSAAGQRPQAVMTLPLLTRLDGDQKMSKSFDNYIAFDDPPEVMYQKLSGVPERLLEEYLRLTTDLHPDETDRLIAAMRNREMTPEQVTRRLAREVVSLYHDPSTAERIDQLPTSLGTGPGPHWDGSHWGVHLRMPFILGTQTSAGRHPGTPLISSGGSPHGQRHNPQKISPSSRIGSSQRHTRSDDGRSCF